MGNTFDDDVFLLSRDEDEEKEAKNALFLFLFATTNAEQTMGIAKDTAARVHNATFQLKSGHPVNVLEDVHRLIISLEEISNTLRNVPVEHVVSESGLWRQMGTNLIQSIKKTVKDL